MKNFIYFAAALVFLIVGVQSQSESQLQCFANFFVDPNNQQALEEISDVCDGLTFEEVVDTADSFFFSFILLMKKYFPTCANYYMHALNR